VNSEERNKIVIPGIPYRESLDDVSCILGFKLLDKIRIKNCVSRLLCEKEK